jgi:uncharacterized protein YdaU (DUF1376 family)
MQGAGLPSTDWRLAALCALSPEEWAEIRVEVVACFERGDPRKGRDPDRLYQETCEDAIALALSQREASRRNGRRGGRPRRPADARTGAAPTAAD